MCEHGDQIEVEITQRVKVDRCIAEEIKWLNAQGVRTEGCCCGHGDFYENAIITPSSAQKAKELGYYPFFQDHPWWKRICGIKGGIWILPLRGKRFRQWTPQFNECEHSNESCYTPKIPPAMEKAVIWKICDTCVEQDVMRPQKCPECPVSLYYNALPQEDTNG